jgi:hypothetical protein
MSYWRRPAEIFGGCEAAFAGKPDPSGKYPCRSWLASEEALNDTKILIPELFLKIPVIPPANSCNRFTLKKPGRKLRAFSSIAETHSGYLFE